MRRPAELTEVRVDGVTYAVRAEPTGVMDSPASVLSSTVALGKLLARLLRRDRTGKEVAPSELVQRPGSPPSAVGTSD